VGQRATEPAHELYSPFSRHSFPGGEEPETEITKEEALSIPVEYASERKIRERNKLYYRFNHWPIWIFVFFIAPGPLTFDLFERGFDARMALWLGAVLVGTGIAGLRGQLPGVEPKPYIIRFTEDRPNPLYRRVCYTFAWSEVITFAVLNITGLVVAIVKAILGGGDQFVEPTLVRRRKRRHLLTMAKDRPECVGIQRRRFGGHARLGPVHFRTNRRLRHE
jgi:hypothetical protein